MAGADLSAMTPATIEAEIVELRRDLDALEGQWLRRLSMFERERAYESQGFLSMEARLVDR